MVPATQGAEAEDRFNPEAEAAVSQDRTTAFQPEQQGETPSTEKGASDYYALILYSAALLNSYISSNSFSVESLGFLQRILPCADVIVPFVSSLDIFYFSLA